MNKKFLGASALILSIAMAGGAQAADGDAAAESELEGIIVTGTRTTGLRAVDSPAPITVLDSTALSRVGQTDLIQAIAQNVPSFNAQAFGGDTANLTLSAKLRGLSPNHALVLINGKRRHGTANLAVLGGPFQGGASADLNFISLGAVSHIEVLQEGAAAQYGSDAIAGVVNLRLREAATGGGLSVTYGQYETEFDGFYGRDGNISDGATTTVSGWQGLPLGADGFLTLSAEYRDRENTNRSDIDRRVTPNRITSRFGDADVEDVSFYANAGKPLGDVWEAYGWFGVQERDASSAATFRTPTDANQNVPAVYPNGYLPKLATDTSDLSAALGLRGEIAGFNADFNVAYGKNDINFGVRDTINPSYGAASQTSFEAGGLEYSQTVFSADFSRGVDVGLAGPLNVAFGLQARTETFEINQGEPTSYNRGPITNVSFGSRGFTGFTPGNEVDVDRDAVGVYVDLEGQLTEQFSASAAVRYEDYSDFGSNTSGKVSARYDFTPAFALRGAVSSGFRAPSLQQQYYTATSILYINGVPFETGTYPSVSPVGVALGGQALDPETSRNYALGLVYRRGAFELTVDAYRIEVEDRIVLSETFQGSATAAPGTNARVIADLLAPFGATAARFFINGVDTETNGVDVVARYRIVDPQAGTFDLTAAGNINEFEVTKTPTASTSVLPTPTSLFGRQAVLRFEEGAPKQKLTLQGDWSREAWGATLRTTFYGSALAPGTLANGSADSETGVRGLVDLEARRTFPMGVTVALGADNLFDVYPRQIPPNLNTTGAAPFSSFSPFGFNGRFLYGRVSLRW